MRYWDTSALVLLIVEEPTSARTRALARRDRHIATWWGTYVECAAALARRHRRRRLTDTGHANAQAALRQTARTWTVVEPAPALREAAAQCAIIHGLTSGDALQLAAALAWADGHPHGRHFVTLDRALAEAARLEGFTVLPAEA